MRALIILSCVVLAIAKPQGYSYNSPAKDSLAGSNTNVAPSIALTAPSFAPAPQFHSAPVAVSPAPIVHHASPAPQHRSVAPAVPQFRVVNAPHFHAPAQTYGIPAQSQVQPTFHVAPAPAPVPQFHAPAPTYGVPAQTQVQPTFHVAPAPAPVPQFHAPAQTYGIPAQSQVHQTYQAPEQSIVQKHIYVHVPPAEQEEVAASSQSFVPLPPRQKHYKIIFIKAPSAAPSYNTQMLQQLAAPQVEEKTLVYVLSKKPEEIPSEVLAARQVQAQVSQPSKPEVYFIKYKAQKDNLITGASSIPVSSVAELPQAPVEVRKPATVYGPAK